MPLFQTAVLNKYLKQQDDAAIQAAYARFRQHFHAPEIQANIRNSKEEQYQEGFLRDLFVDILGYTLNPQPGFQLTTEFKNEKGSRKADGAILQNGKALAVIELKGTDTTDLASINAQAFHYKANHTDCVYVVTSNFERLRFFIDNAVEHLEFDLFTLTEDQFRLLWLCLQRDNLLGGIPNKVKAESLQEEEQVTKRLYKDYSAFKTALWQDLCTNHAGSGPGGGPEHDKLLLYKKTQKLLDRFLFVLFGEDKGLLPPNTLRGILDQWHKLTELDEYRPLYERCQKYFGYLNTGHKSPTQEIFAYNGGLFKPDEVLDGVRIGDAVLEEHLGKLSKYDFGSEVDVNILGHIFEHSLNEIEAITAELEGRALDTKKTKRKKDGVFYTPKYITKYIVENTVGRLCAEKKDELAIIDEEYAKGRKGRQKKTIQELDTKLDVYRDWLLSLTICDPACGSGAFLNQALDFLIAEHRYVDELESKLLGQSIVFKDIGDHILERNIYGVDINEESVEIARLSLWLRTATKGRKLNDLSGNIKCGNSLIDDPAVAGTKAFDWKKEFPAVFAKGGFDVVIGNPPYGAEFDEASKRFIAERYSSYQYKFESYLYFFERGIRVLNRGGLLSFITPELFLRLEKSENIRRFILENSQPLELSFEGEDVFQDVRVNSVVTLFRSIPSSQHKYDGELLVKHNGQEGWSVKLSTWHDTDQLKLDFELSPTRQRIVEKVRNASIRLGTTGELVQGLTAYDSYRGHSKELIEKRGFHFPSKVDESCGKWLDGMNVSRYYMTEGTEWLRYGPWLAAPREPRFFSGPRILFREVPGSNKRIQACAAFDTYYHGHSVTPFVLLDRADENLLLSTLAIVNSALVNWYMSLTSANYSKDKFPKLNPKDIKEIPLPRQGFAGPRLAECARDMMNLSTRFTEVRLNYLGLLKSKYNLPALSRALEYWPDLEFKGFLAELKKAKVQLSLAEEAEWLSYFTTEKAKAQALGAEIAKTDKEIDALVYQLYGLTEEEIAVVEGK
ncbi:MAG: N-6 DNA methylase [Flavobacteriales bacterium]|nr:N-6 DNA methylase [Flavobacteriales bacterium]